MEKKAKIYLFTSPTCPSCPPAKKFMQEFQKERDDFVFQELSVASNEGRSKAQEYGVMSVPTFAIIGPNYPTPIGLRGLQTKKVMNKYIDLSYGIKEDDGKSIWQKFKNIFFKKFDVKEDN